jgi:hypothetical protein
MDIFAITPQELSAERRWWGAMGYAGGAPELIEKHGLSRIFQETYHQPVSTYFQEHPEFAFDPTLFDEFTGHLRDVPRVLPLLGAPVSLPLKEAAALLWHTQGVPGPLEFFVKHGLVDELRQALGGWEPQGVLQIFPEHSDGVVLCAVLWWHHSLSQKGQASVNQKAALTALSSLVHQFEVECALSAAQVHHGVSAH